MFISIPATKIETEKKIRNKITGKVKSYMAFGVIESRWFIQLEHTDYSIFKTFPKFIYEILKERD